MGAQLARDLGLVLPVQPGKGYHVDIDLPAAPPRIPVVLMEERIFVSPIDDFLRMAGTMEFSGFNLTPRPERLEMLVTGAGKYFPEIRTAPVRSRWCHLRPMTPDGLPIIGQVPGTENAWIATGHGMLGITQGPATGRLLAEWIVHGTPSIDLTPTSAERFRRHRCTKRFSTFVTFAWECRVFECGTGSATCTQDIHDLGHVRK